MWFPFKHLSQLDVEFTPGRLVFDRRRNVVSTSRALSRAPSVSSEYLREAKDGVGVNLAQLVPSIQTTCGACAQRISPRVLETG